MTTTKCYETFFVVEGIGQFPFDMLRYDACFPYRGEDAAKMEPHRREQRRVLLCRRSMQQKPDARRWASFEWAVVLLNGELSSDNAGAAVDAVRNYGGAE